MDVIRLYIVQLRSPVAFFPESGRAQHTWAARKLKRCRRPARALHKAEENCGGRLQDELIWSDRDVLTE
jgi:hypothetical protein